jgi:hypothetical protein
MDEASAGYLLTGIVVGGMVRGPGLDDRKSQWGETPFSIKYCHKVATIDH